MIRTHHMARFFTREWWILFLMLIGLTLYSPSRNVLAGPINQVAYSSLTGVALITFDDVAGGTALGTNYDGILESGNADFAERFVGQTNAPAGNFDVLSGTPTAPLALAVGAAGQNLTISTNAGSQILTGLGPLGFPSSDAIGEGAFAILFDFDQSEFGFQLVGGNEVGGNGGTAFIDFFRRDGSLIEQIAVTNLADAFYGFSRAGGIKDIAGLSLYNNDFAGIGFDNLRHDVAGVPALGAIPEPGTWLLLGTGLVGLLGYGWRHRQQAV